MVNRAKRILIADDSLICPYCGAERPRPLEALFTTRYIENPEGGPAIERKCRLFLCRACGRTFDAIEAGERKITGLMASGLDLTGYRTAEGIATAIKERLKG